MILSLTLTTNLVLTVPNAMVNVCSCETPRSVLQADTIVVSCGLANFEQSSWSTHRRHEFWAMHEELHTKEDYDKFVRNFKDNNPAESSTIPTTTDCSNSEDHEVHSGIRELPRAAQSSYDGMHWFFSSKNIVIMICRSGRHRSVANAELWSNTLTRCRRHEHSVSLLHLSELNFWENTCARNCSECSKQSLRVFQAHDDQVQAESLRRVLVPDSSDRPLEAATTRACGRSRRTTRLMRKITYSTNLMRSLCVSSVFTGM